jgi:hypothetical protein
MQKEPPISNDEKAEMAFGVSLCLFLILLAYILS